MNSYLTNGFFSEMRKIAKIRVADVEDELGFYLPDRDEQKVRKAIREATERSAFIRHPWLTGIPTLGLGPVIAKARAVESIKRDILRKSPKYQKVHNEAVQDRWNKMREWEKEQIERERATQPAQIAALAAGAFAKSKWAREEE